MIKGSIKICLAQINIHWEDKEYNKIQCARMTRQAAAEKADLIIFPEMTLTGFSLQNHSVAEVINASPTIEFFASLARKEGLVIVFGVALRCGSRKKNMAIVVDKEGKIMAAYQKTHLFTAAGEEKYFSPGKKITTFNLKGFCLGLAICYDLRFPSLFETLARHRPDAVIVIANWPKKRISHWRTLLAARCLDMQSYLIGVNRIGRGGGIVYNGYSGVYTPWGEQMAEIKKPGILIVQLDKKKIYDARKNISNLLDKKLIFCPPL